MSDLVAWLRAQLDADEARQRGDEHDAWHTGSCGYGLHVTECACGVPARVLAEVDAKRRILDVYRADVVDVSKAGGPPEWMPGAIPVEAHTVLRLLALPYADREGYRDEWRPE